MTGNVVSEFRDVPETDDDVPAPLLRLSDPVYGDGTDSPRPSGVDAEQVAFQVFSQGDESIENDFDLSALWIFWGQFVDHDLDLTLEQEGPAAELLKDDGPLSVTRSDFVTDEDGVRQQENFITAALDASNVYGSSREVQEALRTLDGGRLKTGAVGEDGVALLPSRLDVLGAENQELGNPDAFIAGDIRQTENPGLSAIHTMWVNEHNFWADKLAADNPGMSDEDIFQNARAIVESLIQKITYEEFLPVLVGDGLGDYDGFDPTVDLQITNEFSTAAYRFGHTAIPNQLTFIEEDGDNAEFEAEIVNPATRQRTTVQVDGELGLLDVFDNQDPIENGGVASVLRGVLEERSQKIDAKVVDGLNFFLFTSDGGLTGFSLPERNILRGRDHGTDTYINVRAALVGDIEAADFVGSTDFSIITSDPEIQAALAGVYGTVDQVDLWVGGIAEDHVPGTTLGITFQTILIEQFVRTRDGDEFFYENREFSDEIAEVIAETRLSDVLERSGGVEHVQRDALLASDRKGGTDGNDAMVGSDDRDLMIGFEGNDRLRGHGGDDDIFGDEGVDKLFGMEGSDGLYGGADSDVLFGGSGNDEMEGGDGDDRLFGGNGNDKAEGGEGDDKVLGGNGNDDLEGNLGADTVHGGAGSDTVDGGDGDDVLTGGAQADMIFGGAGVDRAFGGTGNDRISGGDGSDFIATGSGNDVIIFNAGETGSDLITDFSENDTIQFNGFGVGFEDLDITRAGGRFEIEVDGTLVVTVKGPGAGSLAEEDFLFT